METPTGATLLKLSDTQLTLSDPKQDIRGRKVVDSAGQDIGEIDDLMIDNKEKKVRFLQVASGGFSSGERAAFVDNVAIGEQQTAHDAGDVGRGEAMD